MYKDNIPGFTSPRAVRESTSRFADHGDLAVGITMVAAALLLIVLSIRA